MKQYKGIIYVLLSAVLFSLGGILIKAIPWSSVSVHGSRSVFALIVIAVYMKLTHHKFIVNKAVLFGALCNFTMAITFVIATKMTSAANAIVLQFTEPVFVILIMCFVFKEKLSKNAIFACIFVFAGILCFFFDKMTSDGMIGNIIAIVSGLAYAGVFLMKKLPDSDFESSLIISHIASIIIAVPFIAGESDFSLTVLVMVFVLGTFQFGLSYIFLSLGLDSVSPITASLTSTIEPVLNPIIVAVFLGEKIGILSIIGTAMVIGAGAVYNIINIKLKNA